MDKISFVIPCYHSERTIEQVVNEIRQKMQEIQSDYEVILVNDASPDNTFEVIKRIAQTDNRVTAVNFAKNFGQHAALMAGFSFVTGDVVCCLDDDGQTPAMEVDRLLNKLDDGFDVVYARYAHKKHSLFRNLGSRVNAKMTEVMLGKPKDLYISSYFVARRFVIDKMLEYRQAYPYVIGLVLRTTGKITDVEVHHRDREIGESGYTFRKLINLWMNGFTAFSVMPLRIASFAGVVSALFGFVYMLYTIIHKICNPNVVVGWSSTISAILFIGGVILMVLGMIGEYIGRIYICINNSPQYVIRDIVSAENREQ